MKAVYKREMFAYFTSPVGYLVLAFSLLVSGYLFVTANLQMGTTSLYKFFSMLSLILMLFVPLMTMHLWSEERKNKTDQLLLTSNVSVSSIIFGKYFACLSLFAINVAIMLVYPMVMSLYGTVIWSNVFMLYLGYFLMGAALLAVGLFVSTLTESQIVSALVTFVIVLFFVLANMLSTRINISVVSNVINWFSLFTRFDNFIDGIVDVSTLIYYLSFAGLFLFLSIMSIQKKRWS